MCCVSFIGTETERNGNMFSAWDSNRNKHGNDWKWEYLMRVLIAFPLIPSSNVASLTPAAAAAVVTAM